jgi:hypothetical protein
MRRMRRLPLLNYHNIPQPNLVMIYGFGEGCWEDSHSLVCCLEKAKIGAMRYVVIIIGDDKKQELTT